MFKWVWRFFSQKNSLWVRVVKVLHGEDEKIGAIVYETGPETEMNYDMILETRSGYPQRVSKLHASYMSLQFPLLFIYGEDGYSKDLKMIGSTNSSSKDKRLTMLVYYSYYLHDRANRYNYLSRTGKLFQQYVVTDFCAIEQNRIDYIREHQNDIRNEYLSGIYDAISRGDNDGSDCGSKFILPQSFTGGPRRDTGITATRQNVSLDNRYVVPYNKQLLLAFYAHINVEYCGWTMLIK
nr:DNA helicase [Tanacetum cinerariifolium]